MEDKVGVILRLIEEENYMVIGYDDGSLMLYSLDGYKAVEGYKICNSEITVLEVGYRNNAIVLYISSLEDHNIEVFDIRKREIIRRLEGHEDVITAIKEIEETGMLLTCSRDRRLVIWNRDYECVRVIEDNRGGITCMEYNQDQRLIYTGSSTGELNVYEIQYDDLKLSKKINLDHRIKDMSVTPSISNMIFVLIDSCNLWLYDILKEQIFIGYASGKPIQDYFILEKTSKKASASYMILGVDEENKLMQLRESEKPARPHPEMNSSKKEIYRNTSQLQVRENILFMYSLVNASSNIIIKQIHV